MPIAADREAWVVVPARNEVRQIGRAIDALSAAAVHAGDPVHLVIVDDGSTDGTAAVVAKRLAQWRRGDAVVLPGPAAGVGWARRIGLDHALAAAGLRGRDDALVSTTDADSRVPPNWFGAMHDLLDQGFDAVAGDVVLDRGTDPALVAARDERLAARLETVRRLDVLAHHPHFAGANLGWRASALQRLTPLPTPPALEDDALHHASLAEQLRIARDGSFPVTTSARTDGRAAVGLAAALRADAARLGLEPEVA